MTNLLFLFLLPIACIQNVLAQDNVKFTHQGPEPKPFTTLVVSSVKIDVDKQSFFINEVLPEKTFRFFKKLILDNLPRSDKQGWELGSFKIDITTNGNVETYYLETREKSIAFFTKISSVIESRNMGNSLDEEFKIYLRRMDLSKVKPLAI